MEIKTSVKNAIALTSKYTPLKKFCVLFGVLNIFVLFFKAVSIIFKYPEYLLDLKSTNYISLFQVQGHVLEGGKSY